MAHRSNHDAELQRGNKLSSGLRWASYAIFLVSLFLPAYRTDDITHWGLEAFLLGPIGLITGHFSWMANLLLFFSLAMHSREMRVTSLWCAIGALAFASSFLLKDQIAVGSSGIFVYHASIGFYVWMASMGIAVFTAVMQFKVSGESEFLSTVSDAERSANNNH